jgi:hypothetical protein
MQQQIHAVLVQATGNTAAIASTGVIATGAATTAGTAMYQLTDLSDELTDSLSQFSSTQDLNNSLLDNANDALTSMSNDFIPKQNLKSLEFEKYAETTNGGLRQMGRNQPGYQPLPEPDLPPPEPPMRPWVNL